MNINNQKPLLIDSHAHLCDRKISASAVINSMKSDGLDKIITVGYDYASSSFNARIAAENADVFAAVGIHPSDSLTAKNSDYSGIYDFLGQKKVVAVGEIGLDYHYDNTDKAVQKKALFDQLELVDQSGLPAIIHLRDAYEDMQKIMQDNLGKFKVPAILHCFSGSKETAVFYASLGFYISFSGVITYKNAQKYAEIIKAVPKNQLLIETDCPYLTPEPYRGKLNLPCYVRQVADKMAEILGLSSQEIADLTRQNTLNAFPKMKA